jgi:hypothetical protein
MTVSCYNSIETDSANIVLWVSNHYYSYRTPNVHDSSKLHPKTSTIQQFPFMGATLCPFWCGWGDRPHCRALARTEIWIKKLRLKRSWTLSRMIASRIQPLVWLPLTSYISDAECSILFLAIEHIYTVLVSHRKKSGITDCSKGLVQWIRGCPAGYFSDGSWYQLLILFVHLCRQSVTDLSRPIWVILVRVLRTENYTLCLMSMMKSRN